MMKSKVAIVSAWYAPYRLPLFRALALQPDIELTVIFCAPIEGGRQWAFPEELPFPHVLLQSKLLYRYKTRKMFGELGALRYPAHLIRTLRSLDPDIVIGYEFRLECILSALFTIFYRKAYITWSDVTAYHDNRMGFTRKILRKILLLNSKALIGSSTDTLTHFQQSFKYPGDKSFLSILSAHVDDFQKLIPETSKLPLRDGRRFKYIYVGRLIKLKGLDLLIEAFALLARKYPKTHLTIIGDGPERDSLRTQAEILGCARQVEFKGDIPHHKLPQELLSSDVFVFPTRLDCFGLVIAEAIVCQLPVICSCFAGAANDLVKDNGIIVDPTNRTTLVSALERLISDRDLHASMTRASMSVLKKHNSQSAVRGFVTAVKAAAVEGA